MFDECNRLYFNNAVEYPIKFEMYTPCKRTLGMVRPVRSAKQKKVNSIFHISRCYRWTEQTLRHVVVHEMIHLSIGDYKEPLTFVQRLPLIGNLFIKQHDNRFIEMMNDLNKQYNLDIKVRFKEMRKEFIK